MLAENQMGKRGAVRDNSGLPVHQSGPGLGRANNSIDVQPKAGGLPALSSQPKTGRGLGPGPSGGEAAVPSPFNQIQINRNKPAGRGKHCGRFSVQGQLPNSPETRLFHRLPCKCWKCSYCGPRRAKRIKYAIRAKAEALHLQRLLTLTLDPKKVSGDPVQYLNRAFAKLRVYLERAYGVSPQYIRILEFQKNGKPHFHILIDRYIDLEWIRRAWVAVGGGYMIDIRFVDVDRVSRYLSKYLTKELLMSAPPRSRRVTTSRKIKLLEKPKREGTWILVRAPIERLIESYAKEVTAWSFDEDGLLESFTASLNPEHRLSPT